MKEVQDNTAKLEKEVKRLKAENDSLRKLLNAKRYKMADKVANSYNVMLPVGTKRRNIVGKSLNAARRVGNIKTKRKIDSIEKLMKKYPNVLIMSGTAWNTPLPQRSHQLTKEFAKNKNLLVLYYEMDISFNKCKRLDENVMLISGRDVLFSLILDKKQNGYFMFSNVGNVELASIKQMLKNGFELIFECIDELDEALSGGITINQKKILKDLPNLGVKLFVSTAHRLTEQLERIVPESKILLSKNAVNVEKFNYERFKDGGLPADLRNIRKDGKKIIGYYGAIAPWLDYDLIHETAKRHPEYELVFIGVDYDGALAKLDTSFKNIHYLGAKKQSELPSYAVHFDCAIIPFMPGDIAKSTSPIKLFEYMALGLPTVCTKDLNECVGYKYVYVAKNASDFEKFLQEAIGQSRDNNVKKELLAQAENNTWEYRAKEILKALGIS